MMSIKALLEQRAKLLEKGKSILEARKPDAEPTAEQLQEIEALEQKLDVVEADLKLAQRVIESERTAPAAGDAPKAADTEPAKYSSMSEMLKDVVAAARGEVPKKLQANQKWLTASADGFGTSIAQDGGFMVQKDFAAMMLTKAFTTGQLLPLVRRMTLTGPSNGVRLAMWDERSRVAGSRFGGLRFNWVGEGALQSPTKGKLRMLEVNAQKVVGGAYLTEEVMQDAGALDAWISEAMIEELVVTLEDAIVNGTGVGQPLGYASGANNALVTQAIEAGQAANTVVVANLAKMYGRMPAGLRRNAVWLVNQAVFQQLLTLTLGGTAAAFPMFTPPGAIGGPPGAALFGRPVLEVEQASALSAAGDLQFVALSEYLFVDKGGLRQDSSIHVKFLEDEQTLRFVYRAGGAPLWNAPLTPANGSETVSPFVRLAAR